ncbi:hypothetical protein [Aromatoleum evansii]|uniref:Uncharacterized protein n=1 Tax=Aromatoleum evansii TaxID=59406 RepID=A0ABZ1AMP2_AROEV|nr:hypothetical protein [Aromatoleum evansii]WRL45802.1 hypothetical protein U5817_21785 [Aromatoleum evansii]
MHTRRPGELNAPSLRQGPAFAAHRLALYVAFAALLIDQLIR